MQNIPGWCKVGYIDIKVKKKMIRVKETVGPNVHVLYKISSVRQD